VDRDGIKATLETVATSVQFSIDALLGSKYQIEVAAIPDSAHRQKSDLFSPISICRDHLIMSEGAPRGRRIASCRRALWWRARFILAARYPRLQSPSSPNHVRPAEVLDGAMPVAEVTLDLGEEAVDNVDADENEPALAQGRADGRADVGLAAVRPVSSACRRATMLERQVVGRRHR